MVQGNAIISGNFTFSGTVIERAKIVDVKRCGDARGYFMKTCKQSGFAAGGIDCECVQNNQSSSSKGVLRGLHFQIEHPQGKLVRVMSGEVFDVCVDLRKGSPTFGKWEGAVLFSENKRQFFIPRGFAYEFLVLSERVKFCYKCDDVYHPNDEGGIAWNGPDIAVEWLAVGVSLLLSDKDKSQSLFNTLGGAN